tara:strand:- start:7005 stop:7244 length:240 start_codon:yes stop_codon:yes gene_type:complete
MSEEGQNSIVLDIGNIKVSVKLQESGVALDVFKKNNNRIGFCRTDEVIKSSWKTYDELGVELKDSVPPPLASSNTKAVE